MRNRIQLSANLAAIHSAEQLPDRAEINSERIKESVGGEISQQLAAERG
jgi:hypothetical protein